MSHVTRTSNEDIIKFLHTFKRDIEDKMDSMKQECTTQIDSLKSELALKLGVMEEEHQKAVQNIDLLTEKFDFMADNVDELRVTTSSINEQLTETTRTGLVTEHHVTVLEGQLNKLNQEKLVNNLVITGFAKASRPEEVFWNLVNTLEANVRPEDVSCIEILNAKQTNRTQNRQRNFTNINLVKMSNYHAKVELLKRKKAIGVLFDQQVSGPTQRKRQIYFRDHLTAFSNSLFEKARSLKDSYGFKYLWTKDGRILISKAQGAKTYEITSLLDLERLSQLPRKPAAATQVQQNAVPQNSNGSLMHPSGEGAQINDHGGISTPPQMAVTYDTIQQVQQLAAQDEGVSQISEVTPSLSIETVSLINFTSPMINSVMPNPAIKPLH